MALAASPNSGVPRAPRTTQRIWKNGKPLQLAQLTAEHRAAKPSTPVRFRSSPLTTGASWCAPGGGACANASPAPGRRAAVVRRAAAFFQARAAEGSVAPPTCIASPAGAPPGRGKNTRQPAPARSREPSSRVELQHRIRVAAEDLTHSVRHSVLPLPPDDERLLGPHVEDCHDGAPSQRVGASHLGDAVHASPPRP